jgi:hypothetical protein
VVASPDERAVRQHLRSGRFLAGAAAGKWRLISLVWPVALIAVSAAERPNGPGEFVLRLDLSGYPQDGPTGGVWDPEADVSLPADRRPKGRRVGQVFRADGWEGGTAMYAPWDRVALRGHPGWRQAYTQEVWSPTRDLSFVLGSIHELLNSDEYVGV